MSCVYVNRVSDSTAVAHSYCFYHNKYKKFLLQNLGIKNVFQKSGNVLFLFAAMFPLVYLELIKSLVC